MRQEQHAPGLGVKRPPRPVMTRSRSAFGFAVQGQSGAFPALGGPRSLGPHIARRRRIPAHPGRSYQRPIQNPRRLAGVARTTFVSMVMPPSFVWITNLPAMPKPNRPPPTQRRQGKQPPAIVPMVWFRGARLPGAMLQSSFQTTGQETLATCSAFSTRHVETPLYLTFCLT